MTRTILAAAAFVAAAATGAAAQAELAGPNFTLQPVAGGVLKLDTRTGTMSVCGQRAGAWICEAVPEDRAALEAEIARLQARIAVLERPVGPGVPDIMAPPAPRAPDAAPAPRADAPSTAEVAPPEDARKTLDQTLDMAEYAFRRFLGMVDRLRGTEPEPPANPRL